MPKYRVQLEDGRIFEVEVDGEQPPTEAEVLAALDTQPEEDSAGGGAPMMPAVAGGYVAAKAAPAVTAGAHAAAKLGGAIATTRAGRLTPAVIVTDAVLRAARGDVKGAITSAAAAAASTQLPKLFGVVERATAPARSVPGAGGLVWRTKPGLVARAAGAASRVAGRASLPGLIVATLLEPGARPLPRRRRRARDDAESPAPETAIQRAQAKLSRGEPLTEEDRLWLASAARREDIPLQGSR